MRIVDLSPEQREALMSEIWPVLVIEPALAVEAAVVKLSKILEGYRSQDFRAEPIGRLTSAVKSIRYSIC